MSLMYHFEDLTSVEVTLDDPWSLLAPPQISQDDDLHNFELPQYGVPSLLDQNHGGFASGSSYSLFAPPSPPPLPFPLIPSTNTVLLPLPAPLPTPEAIASAISFGLEPTFTPEDDLSQAGYGLERADLPPPPQNQWTGAESATREEVSPSSGPTRTNAIQTRLAQRTFYGVRSDSPSHSLTSSEATPLPTPTQLPAPPPLALQAMFTGENVVTMASQLPTAKLPPKRPISRRPTQSAPRASAHLADQFCRVKQCAHMSKMARDTERHRDTHYRPRYRCPNVHCDKTEGERGWFNRMDSLQRHWRSSQACRGFKVSSNQVEDRGRAWSESDLTPYNPLIHRPGAQQGLARRTRSHARVDGAEVSFVAASVYI